MRCRSARARQSKNTHCDTTGTAWERKKRRKRGAASCARARAIRAPWCPFHGRHFVTSLLLLSLQPSCPRDPISRFRTVRAMAALGENALPQSIADPQGRGVWESRKDPGSGRIFWVNHQLHETRWEAPAAFSASITQQPAAALGRATTPASSSVTLDPARDTLPAGWERRFDTSTGTGCLEFGPFKV